MESTIGIKSTRSRQTSQISRVQQLFHIIEGQYSKMVQFSRCCTSFSINSQDVAHRSAIILKMLHIVQQ